MFVPRKKYIFRYWIIKRLEESTKNDFEIEEFRLKCKISNEEEENSAVQMQNFRFKKLLGSVKKKNSKWKDDFENVF